MSKIMIALREQEHVEALIKLGCQLAAGTGREIIALHVIEIAPALPLDVHDPVLEGPAREILERARNVARENFGVTLKAQTIRARHVGETIAGEAAEQGVDLLILGHHRRHGLEEISLGSTARYLTGKISCSAIIYLAPAPHR